MKIRHGFVSNSSSSSFCILGVEVDYQTLVEKLFDGKQKDQQERKPACNHTFDRVNFKFCPHCGSRAWIVYGSNQWNASDFETALSDLGLEYQESESTERYVGVGIEHLNFDELMALKDKVEQIKEMFGQEPSVIEVDIYS